MPKYNSYDKCRENQISHEDIAFLLREVKITNDVMIDQERYETYKS